MEPSLVGPLSVAIATGLRTIPVSERDLVYAVSLFVCDEDDDPRRPTITVGYNTERQWQEQRPVASSSSEARWNFAFWLQNSVAKIGECGEPSREALQSWMRARGLWYSDDEYETDPDRCSDLAGHITSEFVDDCCRAVRELHAEGVVEEVFGRGVPLLVHELEYYEQIATQNNWANPPGMCDEFVSWIRAM